jgi:hypothetical protein
MTPVLWSHHDEVLRDTPLACLAHDVLTHLVSVFLGPEDRWRFLLALFPRATLATRRVQGMRFEYAIGNLMNTAHLYTACRNACLVLFVRGRLYAFDDLTVVTDDDARMGRVLCGVRALTRRARNPCPPGRLWRAVYGFATPTEWNARFVELLYVA